MKKILYLIRHGMTPANEQRLYCGETDLPLSDAGMQEVLSCRAQHIYPSGQELQFFTSGRLRAVQTLRLIYGDVVSRSLTDFDEYHFGRFEMHGYEELQRDPDYLHWIEDQSGTVFCPGGESRNEFQGRVLHGLSEFFSQMEQSALIVCHGGVISTCMSSLFPDEGRHFYAWQPKPARGFALEISETAPLSFSSIG